MNSSSFTSLALKTAGIVLIVAALLDYVLLAIPFNFLDPQFQINYATQVVDRGIVPLVGTGFLIVAYWIDSNNTARKAAFDLRLPLFVLCFVLGIVFLLIVPLYLNNLRTASTAVQERIEQGATQAENQLQGQYDQLAGLSQNPQQLQQLDQQLVQVDRALETGEFQGRPLSPQQRTQLQEAKTRLQTLRQLAQNPQAIDARLQELQTQLRSQKLEREQQARTEVLRQGLRIGLSSLLLAIAYLSIGWFGTRSLGKKTSRAA